MQLDSSFEDDLAAAVLDEAEHELVGRQNNLLYQTIEQSHRVLKTYGQRHDYDIEPVIESLQQPTVERSSRSIRIEYGWEHDAAPFFARGTSDHTVEGDPLVFEWPDAPQEIQSQFADTFPTVFFKSVDVSGIPESRFVRAGVEWLRHQLR